MTQMTRRSVLGGLAAAGAAALLPRQANAHAQPRHLIIVRLRGAMDALGAVIPHGDCDYGCVRSDLAIARPGAPKGAIDLDGFFGLHPALETFASLYGDGELIVIPAAASGYEGRCHREAQAFLDFGGGAGLDAPWHERLARAVPCIGLAREANTEHEAPYDLIEDLAGRHTTLAARMAGMPDGCDPRPHLRSVAQRSGELRRARLVHACAAAGARIAEGGTRVSVIDSLGWDTHAEQGGAEGRLARSLESLDQAVASLRARAGSGWRRTAVLIATEFGRGIAMNGAGGTDHGRGSAAFLCGGAIAGGRILGAWPGLGTAEGLTPTIDLRAVAKGVLAEHFGLTPTSVDATLFPALPGAIAGLARA